MKKNLFKELLLNSKHNNILLSIYTDKDDTDKFLVGYVCEFDNDFILIKKITPNGVFDGFSSLLIGDVYSIEYNDSYINKIQHNIKGDIINLRKDVEILLESNFRFDDIIRLSMDMHYCLSINSIFDRTFIGYIKDFDGENIIVSNIDEYNKSDGFSLFKISEIERISLFDVELNMINNLY